MKALQTENKITTLSWNIPYVLFVLTQIAISRIAKKKSRPIPCLPAGRD
jgi:cytochrome c-type biogenesis protein CcmH/NrfF